MGHSSSKNSASSITNSLLSVVNQTTQSCVTPVSQNQVASFNATGPGSVNNVGDIDWSQFVTIQSGCTLSTSTINNLNNDIQQAAQQAATTTNGALGLDVGSQSAANITNLTANLATAISNAYQSSCANIITQSQNVSFNATDGGVNNAGDLNWSQTQNDVINCIENNSQVTTASNNLQQAIDQTAKSSVSDLTIIIILIVVGIVVLLIVGLVIFFLMKSQKQGQQFAASPQGQALLKTAVPELGAASAVSGLAGGSSSKGVGGLAGSPKSLH